MYSIVYVVVQGWGKKSWGLIRILMSDNAHIFWRQSHFFSLIFSYLWILIIVFPRGHRNKKKIFSNNVGIRIKLTQQTETQRISNYKSLLKDLNQIKARFYERKKTKAYIQLNECHAWFTTVTFKLCLCH